MVFLDILRGTILNRTYGEHKKLSGIYFPNFTIKNNIWSYSLWSPVIVDAPRSSRQLPTAPPRSAARALPVARL